MGVADRIRWMNAAACAQDEARSLPWTTDTDLLLRSTVAAMRAVCAGCPVAADCETYAGELHLTGGFWAGTDRDPEHYTGPTVQLTLDALLGAEGAA